jgi:hypothetical protein
MPILGVTVEIPVGIRVTASGNFELVMGCGLEVGFGIRNGSADAWANFTYHFSFTYDARASISLNIQARARLFGAPIYGINGDFGRAFQINNAITARCPGTFPDRCLFVVEASHVRRINSLTDWGILRSLSFLRFNLDMAQNLPRTTWFRSGGTWHRDTCPHGGGVGTPPVGGSREVSAGWLHTLETRTDGSLWAWGSNHLGQLGDNK